MKIKTGYFTFILLSCVTLGCISFNAVSLSENTTTFYVDEFSLSPGAGLAPADLGIQFSEKLKERIRNDSRLIQSEINPHVSFSGEISSFRVTSEAPTGNQEQSDIQRLSIGVKVSYENINEPKLNFNKNFSFYSDFDPGQTFLEVQDELIQEIFEDLTSKVFNEAFSNW